MDNIRIIDETKLKEAIDLIFDVSIKEDTSETYSKDPIKGKQIFTEMFEESFYNNEQVLYGYFKENILCGVIGVEDNNFITVMYVDEKCQNMGIGKSLLEYVKNICQEKSIPIIEGSAVKKSVDILKNMGFKITDEEEVYDKYIPMYLEINKKIK